MTYRADEIKFKRTKPNEMEIVLPKFAEFMVYHASTGVDFIKKLPGDVLEGEGLHLLGDVDKIVLKIKVQTLEEGFGRL